MYCIIRRMDDSNSVLLFDFGVLAPGKRLLTMSIEDGANLLFGW